MEPLPSFSLISPLQIISIIAVQRIYLQGVSDKSGVFYSLILIQKTLSYRFQTSAACFICYYRAFASLFHKNQMKDERATYNYNHMGQFYLRRIFNGRFEAATAILKPFL